MYEWQNANDYGLEDVGQPSSNEPLVGDKRAREDDDFESSERQQTPVESGIPTSYTNAGGQVQNGSHQGTISTTSNVNLAAVPSNMDALFVNDLQWVCSFPCPCRNACILKWCTSNFKVDFRRGPAKSRTEPRCQYRAKGCYLLRA